MVLLLLGGPSARSPVTASGSSSRIGLLALERPADRIVILATEVEGEDCPAAGGAYGDCGAPIRNAIASVPGANVLTDVTLSSARTATRRNGGRCGPTGALLRSGQAGVRQDAHEGAAGGCEIHPSVAVEIGARKRGGLGRRVVNPRAEDSG